MLQVKHEKVTVHSMLKLLERRWGGRRTEALRLEIMRELGGSDEVLELTGLLIGCSLRK